MINLRNNGEAGQFALDIAFAMRRTKNLNAPREPILHTK